MIIDPNLVIVGIAVVARYTPKKELWLLVKEDKDGDWTFPRATKRKVESSVKAVIRVMQEKANMDAKAIEEAGRYGGMTSIEGKTVSRRIIYYSMVERSSGEIIGFPEHEWLEYKVAVRRLKSKQDRNMFKIARKQASEWHKEKKRLEEEERKLMEAAE